MRRRIYAVGSSPLVRGARYRREGGAIHCGIIPARAGSTGRSGHPLPWRRDHPRSCGEHDRIREKYGSRTGSSPLVRGARRQTCRGSSDGRIIPARAGSTAWNAQVCPAVRDHPRSCGEHCELGEGYCLIKGSSPLVRGALSANLSSLWPSRIIPARAGSTGSCRVTKYRTQDHPRSCGEHISFSVWISGTAGSSPLVRGAPVGRKAELGEAGIIPARAGSTAMLRRSGSTMKDHPRSCGEHSSPNSNIFELKGSSPLVRGAPCDM